MTSHSVIAPSAMARTVQCPASVVAGVMYPEGAPTADAEVGTAQHEVAAEATRHAARGETLPPSTVGTLASNNVPVTDEMYRAALGYAREIQSVMQTTGVFTPHIEERVDVPRVHEVCFGTPDCWLYAPQEQTLWVWDNKFGYRPHNPKLHWSLMAYAAGILDALGPDDRNVKVSLSIYQPRLPHKQGPARSWSCMGWELRPYINQMAAAADEALGPDPKYRTGPECRDCRASHACDALRWSNFAAIDAVSKTPPADMDSLGMGTELKILRKFREQLDARVSGLEAQIEQTIAGGGVVPYWVLDRPPGRLNWTKPVHEVIALGDALGVDVRKPEAPITPTQAIAAGLDAAIINDGYAKRTPGKTKLTEDTTQETLDNAN